MEKIKQTKIAVHSKEESRRVQDKLFELGCKSLTLGKEYRNLEDIYLYIDKYCYISSSKNDKKYFDSHEYKELYAEDVLNFKKEVKNFDKISLKFTSDMRKDMFGELGNAYVKYIKMLAEHELYERGSQDE